VAGRHLGTDHDLGQAIRMNDHAGRIGEAAGVIAALAASMKCDPINVPFSEIQKHLPEMPNPMHENALVWNLNEEQVKEGLDSDKPGYAIWTAYRNGIFAPLRAWHAAAEPGSRFRRHAAMALAMLGDAAAMPDLREMAIERDDYAPSTSRHSNHKRGYAAVYLLGRIADPESIPLLDDILANQDMPLKYEYHTHAVAALLKIGEAHPETRKSILPILARLLDNPDWTLMSRLKETQTYVRIDRLFRAHIKRAIANWG